MKIKLNPQKRIPPRDGLGISPELFSKLKRGETVNISKKLPDLFMDSFIVIEKDFVIEKDLGETEPDPVIEEKPKKSNKACTNCG